MEREAKDQRRLDAVAVHDGYLLAFDADFNKRWHRELQAERPRPTGANQTGWADLMADFPQFLSTDRDRVN